MDFLSVSYSERSETEVLEAVFPKEYWSGWNPEAETWFTVDRDAKGDPPVFDFIAHEEKAKEAMRDYLERTTDVDLNSRDESAFNWERDFWRVYNKGIDLQKEGKQVRITIG